MQTHRTLTMPWMLRAGPALLLAAGLLAASGASAEMYAWRTEDGGYAYTDDRDQIPARYAAQAERVDARGLADYARLTRTDSAASQRRTEEMERRLRYLRELNAAAPARSAVAAESRPGVRSVSIATGSRQAPLLDIEARPGAAPVVIEPGWTFDSGRSISRSVTVVKQGDETIAVLKGRSSGVSLDDDFYEPRELEIKD